MTVDQLTYGGTLKVTKCWCGIRHAVPGEFLDAVHANPNRSIYCPLGHSGSFKTSTADKLRAELDQAKADAKWQRQRLAAEQQERRAAEERERAATAEVSRTRQRIAGGACPCCNRSFQQLARHMRSQHPDYVDAVPVIRNIVAWSRVRAVAEVVRVAGEPLGPRAVLGRLVLAGRHRDTEKQVYAALHNAERAGLIRRTKPKTWAAIDAEADL